MGGDEVLTYFGHLPPADGALVLAAQHPHSGGTLEADGVVADAHGVDFHVLAADHAQIFRVGGGDTFFRIRHFGDFKSKEFVKIRKTQPNFVNDSSLALLRGRHLSLHVVTCGSVANDDA